MKHCAHDENDDGLKFFSNISFVEFERFFPKSADDIFTFYYGRGCVIVGLK